MYKVSTLLAANIKKGVNIFGVTGTFVGWVDNPLTIWNGSTAYYGCSMSYSGSSKTYKDYNMLMPNIPITVKKVEVSGKGGYTGAYSGYNVELWVWAYTATGSRRGKCIAENRDWNSASVQVTNYAITDSNFLSVLNTGLASRSTSFYPFKFTITGDCWGDDGGGGWVTGQQFTLLRFWQ